MNRDFDKKFMSAVLRDGAPRRPGQAPRKPLLPEFLDVTAATAAAQPMDMDLIPQEWRDVLASCRILGAESAIIAGGALRDLHNGKTVKDVDIFLPLPEAERDGFVRMVFTGTNLSLKPQFLYSDYGNDVYDELRTNGNTIHVKAGPEEREYHFCFVRKEITSPLEIISSFDIGLCQIAWDGANMFTTDDYVRDRRLKTLRPVRPNSGTEWRLKNLGEKYEDWKVQPVPKLEAPKP